MKVKATRKKKAAKPQPKQKKTVYECPYCDKQFDNGSNRHAHVKLHSTEEPYHCELCDYKCKVKKYLSRHVKKVHTKPTGHQCSVCGKCFHFSNGLRTHMRVHTGERPYKCNDCDKAFSSLYTLQGHKLIHTGEKPFQCQYCDYACRDSSTIRRHMERHLGISKDYPCSICNKNFKKKETLQNHVDEVHFELDTRKHKCKVCDKPFKTKGTLKFHVITVHMKTNRVKCEICGRLSTKNNLQAHMRRHIDMKPYKCSYKPCGKSFADKGDLNRHLPIHYPENQHMCTVCNRRFSRKFRLTRHMRNGCRRAQCHHCGQLFSTKFFVAQHIKNAHGPYPKSREYLCDVCDVVTYSRRCIIQHLKYGHGTEKDTKCQICKKDLFKHVTLKEHYLSHHNLKYCLLDEKKEDIVAIKHEPLEVEQEMGESPEFMYEVDIQKQEIIDDTPPDLLQPASPEHFTIDSDTITYSKKVLSEDISLCLLKRDSKADVFDDFFIGHVMQKREVVEPPKQIVDEKKKECVEKRLEELLNKARIRSQWVVLEKLRQQYNRRIKMATGGRDKKEKPKQNIRYYKNPESKNSTKTENNTNGKETQIEEANDNVNNQDSNDTDQKLDSGKEDKKNTDQNDDIGKYIQKNDDTTSEINDTKDKSVDNVEQIDDNHKNTDQNNDIGVDTQNDDKTGEKNDKSVDNVEQIDDEEINDDAIDDAKDLDYKESDFEGNSDEEVTPNGKITFNTHQCYICFKLFKTKSELKIHCKHHFEICNDKMLKKCPFCGYVTNLTITRHMKLVHNVSYDIRKNGRIKEKNTENGPKYVFEIDKDCDLEIIPSISNLNKIASMKIDEKKRETSNLFLGKTKLVKQGGDWMVQRQKVDIDCEYLLPEFSEHEYLALKCIGDTYLERIRSLSILAKKKGLKILYPCEGCDKICLSMSALKLHNRKHEANPKRFKPKVWKNKIVNGFGRYTNVNKKSTKKNKYTNDGQNNNSVVINKKSRKKNGRLEKVSKNEDLVAERTPNRFADPNPVKNNHKCDRKLIEFYHKNIKGGDIEFWQFLKIFNKMSRENVNDFKDLENRFDFGMHNMKINDTTVADTAIEPANEDIIESNTAKTKKTKLVKKKKAYIRAILISKKEYLKRLEIKNQMRERLKMSST